MPDEPPPEEPKRLKVTKPAADIAIVVAVSAVAYYLEGLANKMGWISIGVEARGVSGVLAGALSAVFIVLARGGTLARLGFKRPKRWRMVPLQVIAILVIFILMQNLAPLLASLFVEVPAPDFSRHAEIAGNLKAAIAMSLLLPLTASIPEEIIYRGFLIGRLTDIFGRGVQGALLSVGSQALIFGAVHFQWGIGGMLMTTIMGLVWGAAYLMCGRNLWVVILAHSAGHILFVIQLYLSEPIIF